MKIQKWEYKVLSLKRGGLIGVASNKKWEEELNKLGKEGWELVNITMGVVIMQVMEHVFKRKLK